jgi:streptogramin lyase
MRNRDHAILGGTILALALGVSLASHGAGPGAGVSDLKVTIREWDVPTKGAHPHDPAVGPDGALWFTEQMANKLGRLDPAAGTFKEYRSLKGRIQVRTAWWRTKTETSGTRRISPVTLESSTRAQGR